MTPYGSVPRVWKPATYPALLRGNPEINVCSGSKAGISSIAQFGSCGEPQRGDCRNDCEDEQNSHEARRLVEPEDPDGDRPDRADAAPDGVGRPHGNRPG